MPGNLTFAALKKRVQSGAVDTVLACQIDMQGRLMGKRFQAGYFIEEAFRETHSCNYLQATDLEMMTVDGYAATGWAAGYGDYVMLPDMSTLRLVPWLQGTAMVLCDVADHESHGEVAHSPRAVLKNQVRRLAERGWVSMAATELEFFLFQESFETLAADGYRAMTPISPYNEDYHIFQTTKEEHVMRAIRNGLTGAGVPVENTKGEAEAGQAEINVHYSDALDAADNHVIVKNACKEIAWQQGRALTFLAKWNAAAAGSSSHLHQSLWAAGDGKRSAKPLFYDRRAEHGMSDLMRHYLAGLLAYSDEMTFFLAPYVNSYKRFAPGMFAPTRAVWSCDNRTAGYRVCAPGGKAVRVECRIGGSDLNPYLALAAQIAAGLAGIEQELPLEEAFVGDAYRAEASRSIPQTLLEAKRALEDSAMLREAFGDAVVTHYVRAAEWELTDFNRGVTDYEVRRGFERA